MIPTRRSRHNRAITLAAVFVAALAGCEPEPCAKDKALDEDDIPCECEGVVIDSLDCGSVTCTPYGPYASTGDSTDCSSTSPSTTTSSR